MAVSPKHFDLCATIYHSTQSDLDTSHNKESSEYIDVDVIYLVGKKADVVLLANDHDALSQLVNSQDKITYPHMPDKSDNIWDEIDAFRTPAFRTLNRGVMRATILCIDSMRRNKSTFCVVSVEDKRIFQLTHAKRLNRYIIQQGIRVQNTWLFSEEPWRVSRSSQYDVKPQDCGVPDSVFGPILNILMVGSWVSRTESVEQIIKGLINSHFQSLSDGGAERVLQSNHLNQICSGSLKKGTGLVLTVI